MTQRRTVVFLCVYSCWKSCRARSLAAGFKLLCHVVDGKRRNGVGVVLKEEFVWNVLGVKGAD